MPCYQPLQGWYSCDGDTKGAVIFARQPGRMYIETALPCGKCIGCRMEQARQWAIRCMHEAEDHENNCMVTLTYDEQNVPADGSLQPMELQLWLKRLRKKFPSRIRYFACGEYGDQYHRPHYHCLLFGIDFDDSIEYNPNSGLPSVSELQETWTNGYVKVSPFTYESAAYVARYVIKKQKSEDSYLDKTTGVIRSPEFTRMSRMPGIGCRWLQQNYADTYKDDTVIFARGQVTRPPRYYDKKFEQGPGAGTIQDIKKKRIEESFKRRSDSTPEKLRVREIVAKARLAQLKRGYEND